MTRTFFRNAGILSLAQLVAALKGLVLLPLLTHTFGAVNYGAWAQVSIIVGLLPPVIVLGTDSAVIRFLPGRDTETQLRVFAGWLFAIAGLGGAVCIVLALARAPVATIFFGHAGQYEQLVPLAAATLWASLLVYGAQTWFRIRNDAPRLAAVTIAQAVLGLLATLIMLAAHQGVYDLVLYVMIGDLLIAGWLLAHIARHHIGRPDFTPLRRYVRFGLPLLPGAYAVWALNWLDRLFLIGYGTLADVGIYSAAYGLAYMAFQTIANPIFAMYPNLASQLYNTNDHEQVQRLFERSAGAILVIIVPVIAGTAILGPELLRLLVPRSFAGAAPVVPLVMAGYLCFLLAAYYEITFALIEKPQLTIVPVVAAFTLNLGLNFLLIPPYGYIGAAIATSAAFGAQLVVAITMVQRTRVLVTPFGYAFRVLLAGAVMALLLGALMHFVHLGTLGGLVVGALFGTVVYAGLCVALRLVPADARLAAADIVLYALRPFSCVKRIRGLPGSLR